MLPRRRRKVPNANYPPDQREETNGLLGGRGGNVQGWRHQDNVSRMRHDVHEERAVFGSHFPGI